MKKSIINKSIIPVSINDLIDDQDLDNVHVKIGNQHIRMNGKYMTSGPSTKIRSFMELEPMFEDGDKIATARDVQDIIRNVRLNFIMQERNLEQEATDRQNLMQ